ncbi:MAG TPA: hypothetical protein VFL51_16060 [Pseudolabrys sp.]|nr:hypothetical protein [Pseudolabrys sp.]
MLDDVTIIAGIPIPSTSPVFLTTVGFHVLLGLACIVTGAIAMLSNKGRGRHSNFGTNYYWCLLAVFVSATALAAVRWREDYHLFVLGMLSFTAAYLGRRALRQRWRKWPWIHVVGMAASYILLLTAFYVDNGKNLPLWRELPQIAFWLLPAAIGIPILVSTLLRHPVIRRS